MILHVYDLQPEDQKHLHCTDPRVSEELAAVNRSLHRLGEKVTSLTHHESTPIKKKEVN